MDVILVTIDTWRADAAGFAGNANVETPFLDSLASRGVVFSNAHAQNVVTLPSHANILTGLNPYQHGVRENAGYVLDEKTNTLAERLKAFGYATGAFVAAYPLDRRYGLAQGFDVYDDNYGKGRATLDFTVQERPATAVLESAAKWWHSQEGKKRFLWVHLYEPHAPYVPSYLGEVGKVDAALQQHLAPIVNENTIVIVTSDHGEALGDHGELTHGLFAYEATLKVPLIVAAKGLKTRNETKAVQHIDIAPTVLGAAGAPPAGELPGQDLLGQLAARDTYFEALSASLSRGWAPLTGLIRNDAKFIELPIAELYDLKTDPAESKNLYIERRRDAVAARTTLASLQTAPAAPRNISAEEVERLRSLGYIAGSTTRGTKDDPKTLLPVDQKMHRVIDSFQHGKTDEAIQLAREVVAAQPRMAAGRELLAFVLQESNRVDEAIDVLQRIVKEGQGSEATKVQLALLLNETKRPAEASALLAPIASNTDNPDVLNAYGLALADQGKVQEGIAQLRRSLELDPNNAPAVQNIGILALRADDVAAAQRNLEAALALNPRLPLALNSLGVVKARQNDFNAAIDLWKKAIELDPKQYDALFNVALVATRTGRREDALWALDRFARTAPPSRYGREIAEARAALARLK
ncbi:MAG TPA: sulfatase-like hydrolase/transferase [Thermoanaerobaculia bacterium]|jgi:arylsulfatase A-like enzyme/predicted negative regulator of RcsB-dependent stress response|nr:sulfatase-like hydrolase/transferase [Thermoanaerobaculia bacterium]